MEFIRPKADELKLLIDHLVENSISNLELLINSINKNDKYDFIYTVLNDMYPILFKNTKEFETYENINTIENFEAYKSETKYKYETFENYEIKFEAEDTYPKNYKYRYLKNEPGYNKIICNTDDLPTIRKYYRELISKTENKNLLKFYENKLKYYTNKS